MCLQPISSVRRMIRMIPPCTAAVSFELLVLPRVAMVARLQFFDELYVILFRMPCPENVNAARFLVCARGTGEDGHRGARC